MYIVHKTFFCSHFLKLLHKSFLKETVFDLRKTNLGFLNRDLPVIGVSSTICLISFVIAKSTTSVHSNGKTTILKSNQLNSSMSSWINISLFVVNHFTFYFFALSFEVICIISPYKDHSSGPGSLAHIIKNYPV